MGNKNLRRVHSLPKISSDKYIYVFKDSNRRIVRAYISTQRTRQRVLKAHMSCRAGEYILKPPIHPANPDDKSDNPRPLNHI
jgi:hypothetical protein